jgi:diguanylate cyclase (GGDEF)-like protein
LKIRDHASNFGVFILAADSDWGAAAKVELARAGYESYLYTDFEGFSPRLREMNPHVLVFAVPEVPGKLSEFVQGILKFNPEMRFVMIGEASQYESLKVYEDFGLEQFIVAVKDNLGARVLSAVDRVCEKLYYLYQNEQLLEDLKNKKIELPPMASATPTEPQMAVDVTERVNMYQMADTKETLIQSLFDSVRIKPLLYFRFLSAVSSFVATQAAGFTAKEIQGVGCQVEGLTARDLGTQITLGVVPAPLQDILKRNFGLLTPRLHPVFSAGQLDGIIVYPSSYPDKERNLFHDELSLFSMAYNYLDLKKRVEALEVQDPVTEVFNRKHYEVKLLEEVERSLRIKQAVSLIKFSIDDYFEIEQTVGETAKDLILKKIMQLVHKSNRTNDFIARTGQNEFAIVLPHTHRQGALTRAERIRRTVESSLTLESGVKISVSIGVSEYPSLCKSAQSLDETATKALNHISEKGGNKICLFKAPPDHTPQFNVRVEPG